MLEQKKDIRGLPTYWLQSSTFEHPDRPILFFLHGFPDSPEVWQKQFEYFSPSYDIVAPYLRGPKEQVKVPKERFELDALSLDYFAILREIDPEGKRPVAIVAHDLGGPVAWHFAQLLKNRLHSLTYINAANSEQMGMRLSGPSQLAKSWYIFLFQIPRFSELLFQAINRPIFNKVNRVAVPSAAAMIPHYRVAFRSLLNTIIESRSLTRYGLAPLRRPTLFVSSEGDPYLNSVTINEARALTTRYTIRYLQGGHWVQQERPEEINQILERFWQEGK